MAFEIFTTVYNVRCGCTGRKVETKHQDGDSQIGDLTVGASGKMRIGGMRICGLSNI